MRDLVKSAVLGHIKLRDMPGSFAALTVLDRDMSARIWTVVDVWVRVSWRVDTTRFATITSCFK